MHRGDSLAVYDIARIPTLMLMFLLLYGHPYYDPSEVVLLICFDVVLSFSECLPCLHFECTRRSVVRDSQAKPSVRARIEEIRFVLRTIENVCEILRDISEFFFPQII